VALRSEDSDRRSEAGRDETFTAFYRENLDDVYRYCFFRLGTREAAEDATSEIFAKALTSFDSFQGRGSRRSWLFSIAHNAVVDQHRRKRPVVPLDDLVEIEDERNDPESAALNATEQEEVRSLLWQLPDTHRHRNRPRPGPYPRLRQDRPGAGVSNAS
jgi:RNA polymerase sigma factor (sigma-70 family)